MSEGRIFADDWRACLREQYKYVIQQQDVRTEATLTHVMHDAGFSDDELAALRLEATMRADDMPDDYVPEEVQHSYAGVDVPEAPTEAVEEASIPLVDVDRGEDADEIDDETPSTYDELVEQSEEPSGEVEVEEVSDEPDDSPEQLSLF